MREPVQNQFKPLGVVWIDCSTPSSPNTYAIVDADMGAELSQYTWGVSDSGYARTTLPGPRTLKMHQAILKADDGMTVDHINRDKLDNRRANLRSATMSQQIQNQGLGSNRRYKGAYRHSNCDRWEARIRYKDKAYYLGLYETDEDAAKAYDKAALFFYGEDGYLNFEDAELTPEDRVRHQLLYDGISFAQQAKSGPPGGTRTPSLPVRSRMLDPIKLRAEEDSIDEVETA